MTRIEEDISSLLAEFSKIRDQLTSRQNIIQDLSQIIDIEERSDLTILSIMALNSFAVSRLASEKDRCAELVISTLLGIIKSENIDDSRLAREAICSQMRMSQVIRSNIGYSSLIPSMLYILLSTHASASIKLELLDVLQSAAGCGVDLQRMKRIIPTLKILRDNMTDS
ncbi:MAG: hypothetical protein EZS28_041952 [Streblomastix strix]|uniref:Uncharacterized protein n=1 Tax=Streblomastix strix TaxID=222440 RepID=A0A5J4TWS4_9EUKA|nr:MAG: hypothetical protein EZS28_041952 [Streblomastix strix]